MYDTDPGLMPRVLPTLVAPPAEGLISRGYTVAPPSAGTQPRIQRRAGAIWKGAVPRGTTPLNWFLSRMLSGVLQFTLRYTSHEHPVFPGPSFQDSG